MQTLLQSLFPDAERAGAGIGKKIEVEGEASESEFLAVLEMYLEADVQPVEGDPVESSDPPTVPVLLPVGDAQPKPPPGTLASHILPLLSEVPRDRIGQFISELAKLQGEAVKPDLPSPAVGQESVELPNQPPRQTDPQHPDLTAILPSPGTGPQGNATPAGPASSEQGAESQLVRLTGTSEPETIAVPTVAHGPAAASTNVAKSPGPAPEELIRDVETVPERSNPQAQQPEKVELRSLPSGAVRSGPPLAETQPDESRPVGSPPESGTVQSERPVPDGGTILIVRGDGVTRETIPTVRKTNVPSVDEPAPGNGRFDRTRAEKVRDGDDSRGLVKEAAAPTTRPQPIGPAIAPVGLASKFGEFSTAGDIGPTGQPDLAGLGPAELEDAVRTANTDRPRPEPVAARAIINQVIQSVTRSPGDGVFEVRLHPEELGRVRLAMTTTDAGLTVQVTAERAETMDLIRRNIDMFESDLRGRGFEQFSFSFGAEGSDRGFSQGEDNRPPEDVEIRPGQGRDLTVDLSSAAPVQISDRLDIRV